MRLVQLHPDGRMVIHRILTPGQFFGGIAALGEEEGVLLDLPLSREDLANLTGTTLYTTSRILSQWEQRGIVRTGRQRLVVRAPHALVQIAEDLSLPSNKEQPAEDL